MRHGSLVLAAFLGLGQMGGGASAIEVSYDLGFYSHYVWRGITLTDDPVFQPAVTVSHASGFSANVWGNLDMGDANRASGDFSEIDVTLDYTWDFEALDLSVGLIDYSFPNLGLPGTREVYLGVGFDVLLSPGVTVYYDFDELEDFYVRASLEYGNDLSDRWSYSLGASVAYAGDGFALGGESGMHDGNLSLALEYATDVLTAGLLAAYTDSLDDDVLPEQPTDFWGGFYIGLSF